jgi:predicted short-subunit dehydrogenase-like oxidoreductase (DUF2520 family)
VTANNSIRNIAFAGAGNVAWHLAHELVQKDYRISGIWSRDLTHAAALAESCKSVVCEDLHRLTSGTDLIVIAVPDRAIDFVAGRIGSFDGIIVHTAASVSIDILKPFCEKFGSFYPLQTFSKEINVSLRDVPIFLEASSETVMRSIKQIALDLSTKVYEADSRKRLLLHVAAVFAGNYSNLMYVIGNELLRNADLPVEVLHPLMIETTRKAVHGDALKMQTGPARRKDIPTLDKHLEALAPFPEYAELYRLLSKLIIKQYK